MTRPPARALAGACLLAAALLAGPAAAAAQSSSTVLGGYRPAATDDAMVQQAGAALAEQIGGELASIDSASSGGLSWRLEITLADGARWSGVVGIRLPDRSFVVSGQPVQLQPPPGEGEETDTGSNEAPDDDDDEA